MAENVIHTLHIAACLMSHKSINAVLWLTCLWLFERGFNWLSNAVSGWLMHLFFIEIWPVEVGATAKRNVHVLSF